MKITKKVLITPEDFNRLSETPEGGFRVIHTTWQLRLCQKYQDLLLLPSYGYKGNPVEARVKEIGNNWTALEVFK